MQNINFVLAHMYHLKYFIPLVIEANNRGIQSTFYTFFENKDALDKLKTTNNHPYKHFDDIIGLGNKYGFKFKLRDIRDNNINGLTFFGERRGLSNLIDNKNIKKVVLTTLNDFAEKNFYDWYCDKVDSVVFASEFIARYYNKVGPVNSYLGSPKYDVALDKSSILTKYNLGNSKNALILFPELNTLKNIDLHSLYDEVRGLGYKIIIKGRQKQPAPEDLRGDAYFDDGDWFPHPTMELIEVSDLVISFDSSVSKECTLASVPHINIHITPWMKVPFGFLYEYKCCRNIDPTFDRNIREAISEVVSSDLTSEFEKCQREKLFVRGDSSKRILDKFYVDC